MDTEPAHSISKRGRVGEGRPTLYTPELANRLADHIAAGPTDEEAAALEDISCDCIKRSPHSEGVSLICYGLRRIGAPGRLLAFASKGLDKPAERELDLHDAHSAERLTTAKWI
jgi:hypothetical protein